MSDKDNPITLQADGRRAVELKRHDGEALRAGDLVAGQIVRFDASTFITDAELNRKARRAKFSKLRKR